MDRVVGQARSIVLAAGADPTLSRQVASFFHEDTFTVSHVVWDAATGLAAAIDVVLDYDPASGRTSHGAAEAIIGFLRRQR